MTVGHNPFLNPLLVRACPAFACPLPGPPPSSAGGEVLPGVALVLAAFCVNAANGFSF
jgi:hypothetical protein